MANTYVVEREQQIKGTPTDVLDRIVDFRRWQAWSPWEDIDPNLERTYSGAESGAGATYAWSGNRKAGTGRMEILTVAPGSVTIDLQFLKPFKSKCTTEFTLVPDGDTTVVRWRMTGPQTVMTRVMGIFSSMDKLVGKDFEKGLGRLKSDVESS